MFLIFSQNHPGMSPLLSSLWDDKRADNAPYLYDSLSSIWTVHFSLTTPRQSKDSLSQDQMAGNAGHVSFFLLAAATLLLPETECFLTREFQCHLLFHVRLIYHRSFKVLTRVSMGLTAVVYEESFTNFIFHYCCCPLAILWECISPNYHWNYQFCNC